MLTHFERTLCTELKFLEIDQQYSYKHDTNADKIDMNFCILSGLCEIKYKIYSLVQFTVRFDKKQINLF